MTTMTWFLANRYLRQNANEADVEWGYSFDVHTNAFFPPLVLLHFVQLIFYNSEFRAEMMLKKSQISWILPIDINLIKFFFFNILLGVINSESFFSRLFGNTIWLIAFMYYIYITFLGYNCKYSSVSISKNGRQTIYA